MICALFHPQSYDTDEDFPPLRSTMRSVVSEESDIDGRLVC